MTFTESSANGAPPVNETRSSSVLIARDGEKRREEFDVRGGGRIVYVESPAGRSVLLPAGKLYADLNVAAGGPDVQTPDDLPGVSADLLVNEAPAAATYQRMGTEVVAGRQTTKYRVTSGMKAAGTDSTAETLIWIDEALGMPVKSETVNNSSVRSSKATMELKDIRLEVDPALFVLPQDYKKVPVAVIFEMVRKGPGGQVPKR